MKLRRIEIAGFKSFREQVSLDLSPGISAIVGPNGCGKSNIVDAVRWAMGEQRVKSLRGKAMDDVIFSGSEESAQVGLAEVSLILSRGEHPFPGALADCAEVMITRRIRRDQENEYLINRTRVRHLDVREFFLGTGVGVKSYSLVEQNSVVMLIESKPEDLRYFIEEAAGISKYRGRREIATRKLEATRQNLLRLTDVIQEVKKGLNSTSRQAKRAEQYRELKREIKEGEIVLALQVSKGLLATREDLAALVEGSRDEEAALNTELANLEASFEEIKQKAQEHEQIHLKNQEDIYRIKSALDIKEQEIAFAEARTAELSAREDKDQKEAADLKRREREMAEESGRLLGQIKEAEEKLQGLKEMIEQGDGEIKQGRLVLRRMQEEREEKKVRLFDAAQEKTKLENQLSNLKRSGEDLQRRQESAAREEREQSLRADELAARVDLLKGSLGDNEKTLDLRKDRIRALISERDLAREALGELEVRLSELNLQKGGKGARLQSLTEFRDGYTWLSDGPRSIMNRCRDPREGRLNGASFLGLLADLIEVSEGYETAVEAALGDKLQYIAVASQGDALEGIGYLKSRSLGRGSFIALDMKPAGLNEQKASAKNGEDTVRLAEVVKFRQDFQEIGESLLGDIYLTGGIETGLGLWRQNGLRRTFVTPEGDLISPEGVIAGGYTGGGQGNILKIKREMSEIETELTGLDREIDSVKEERQTLQTNLNYRQEELAQLRSDEHRLDLLINGQKKDLERYQDELRRVKQRLGAVGINISQLTREIDDGKGRIGEIQRDLKEKANQESVLKADLEEWKGGLTEAEKDLEEKERRLTEEKIVLTACNERRLANIKEQTRIATASGELQGRKEKLEAGIEENRLTRAEVAAALEGKKEEVKILWARLEKGESLIAQTREGLTLLEESLKTLQEKAAKKKGLLLGLSVRIVEKERALRETAFQLEAMQSAFASNYQIDLFASLEGFEMLPEGEITGLKTAVQKKKEALESFGEVNLLALEEYERYKERYDFLSSQTVDLKSSIEALMKTIGRINQVSRRRFAETFAAVNENFREIFSLVFSGGRGNLRLTNEEDLLSTGIDMDIQIPGKKVQSLGLLSGGEKTMSAIALIFSILRYRPAPFIVLDEVDAALDDANIGVFNRLVCDIAKNSQVIVVTHNKLTMEAADNLYGITMQKQGISSVISVKLT